MPIGTVFPPEWRWLVDAQTGRPVQQLTALGSNYQLYFYNPSVTPDGRSLVFYSDRTGLSNLFRLDLASGEILQLTDAGPARAEYWPFSPPIRGVAACLAALGDEGRAVYYFEGNALQAVDLDGRQGRRVLDLPVGRRPSILHADAAGRTLVFATWDEALFQAWSQRAYAGERFAGDDFFQETTSTIERVDPRSGQAEEVLRRPAFWINHALVHPTRPHQILFCHEFTSQPDRMWLLDTQAGSCAPVPGQAPDEWYEHEFWSADGERVCFHGGWKGQPERAFCGWYEPASGQRQTFAHATPGRAYAHYNLHPGGRAMVTDGEARPGCISRVHLRDGQQVFEVLCRHDSYEPVEDQRAHPHPSFTPDGRRVVFTANHGGRSNIYMVDWEAG
jgi:oligogalacturonide lyase